MGAQLERFEQADGGLVSVLLVEVDARRARLTARYLELRGLLVTIAREEAP
jgi:hypothetical protein